jgi:hypothetical protein
MQAWHLDKGRNASSKKRKKGENLPEMPKNALNPANSMFK